MCGFVLVCVDLGFFFTLLCFSSNAPGGSLKLMGPPVASLLIFLHPSPLGGVLAVCPRPPDDQRGSRVALLRLLAVFWHLAADRSHILRPFLGVLILLRHRSSCLEPQPTLLRARLLLLGVGSFGLQS